MLREEIWKDIEGYEGLYMVSNCGRVKSIERIVPVKSGTGRNKKGTQTVPERILKPELNRGYSRVTLSFKGKIFRKLIHQFVAIAFIDNPENKKCVNHIDGNRSNNNLSNLEWCTYAENEQHSYTVLGKINANRKLNSEDVEYILNNAVKSKRFLRGGNIKEMCKRFKVTENVVHNIINRKNYV